MLYHHRCRERLEDNTDQIKVVDPARATHAAPTYFNLVETIGKLLVDGGFNLANNPSKAAWDHYFELN
ncbi:hypothetical protein H2198_008399 [Neophaeococcomyces mojaviensis]|uniref:Uncharacterized protein n=1 Tax=Neophaeococcomyces mojaviensis TaxID=3383035 RepID=A0ACC2ZXI0_9EURO|nr:hypothetical protein H2198_008399 [Knufia sp. JES_112]